LSCLTMISSIFSLISILPLSSEIMSPNCSNLLFVWIKGLFISGLNKSWNKISAWFLFSEVFLMFVQLLFYISCCHLYFTYLFFNSVLYFTLVFVEVLNSFICFCFFSCSLFFILFIYCITFTDFICWIILTSLEWNQLDHGMQSL
jgi:hypothetical protein